MCIYLSDNAIFVLIFIAGLVLGAIIYHRLTAPMNKEDRENLQDMRRAIQTFERRPRKPPHTR